MAIEETRCPDCGGPMVPRNSSRGKFWGCKKYPKCKGTRNSDGEAPRRRDDLESERDDNDGLPSDRLRQGDRRRWQS